MPINCLIKFLINFWTVMFQKSIHGQFVKDSWTLMFQKDGSFAFRPSSFVSSSLPPPLSSSLFLSFPLFSSLVLSRPLFLSFFNVRPAKPANSLKTKYLKKRHFWLKFLSPGKPLRLRMLGAKLAQWFVHFPADPTLHTPPETDPTCSAAKPCIM